MAAPSIYNPLLSPKRSWIPLLVVGACLIFIGLGRLPLLEPDEGRNAEVAREMLLTRDWITPHFNGLTYLDKPNFLFWTIAGSFRAFGTTEWAARFPSALAALATLLLVWLMAARMFGEGAAFRAGIILATAPLFFGFARFVIFDMPLTLWVSLALTCFWLNSQRAFASRGLDALAFAAMGLATLTKGPVGFLLPLLALAAYGALAGRMRELKKVHWLTGWLVLFAVVFPWFITVSIRNPDFPRYALWEESLLRFTTGAHLRRSGSVFYYIPVYLAGFFPWSFFLLFAGWNRLKRWRELRQPAHSSSAFLIAWAGVIFGFFSVSHSKLPGYFLPALIPLSVLMAAVWREERDPARGTRLPDWLTAGLASMIFAGLLVAAATRLLGLHSLQIRLAAKLPPSLIAALGPSLLLSGMIIASLGFLGRNLATRRRGPRSRALAFAVVACTFPLLILRWIKPAENYFNVFSSRRLARTILASPQRDLPVYGYYYFRTGLPFYLHSPVGLVTNDGDEMTSNYVVSRFKTLSSVTRGSLGPLTSARRLGLANSRPMSQVLRPPLHSTPVGEEGGPRCGTGEGPRLAGLSLVSATGGGSAADMHWMAEPLFISGSHLQDFANAAPGPFLLMVRNTQVNQALSTAGAMKPLWQAWEYSVWEKKPE